MTGPAARQRPGPGRRAILLAFGVVLALGLTEGGLQLLRVANLARLDPEFLVPGPEPGRKLILCLGDSHTWGFGLNPHLESYPVRLAHQLDDGDPEGPFVVENLGFPGFNTSQVLDRLRRRLDEVRPDLVLVLAGYNNSWNPATADPRGDRGGRWFDRLVLPRLWKLLTASPPATSRAHGEVVLEGDVPFVVQEDGTRIPIRGAQAREGLREGRELTADVKAGLVRILEECRAQRIPVVLQTYVSERTAVFRAVNAGIRLAAQQPLPTPLIDQARWFEARGLDPRQTLQPDGHPTAFGCENMAECVVEALRGLPGLEDWPFDQHGARTGLVAQRGAELTLEPLPGEGPIHEFRLGGPPGGVWQLHFSRSRAQESFGIGIARDEVFEACRGRPGLFGRFDAAGQAVARAYPQVVESLGSPPEYAQLLLLDPYSNRLEDLVLSTSPVLAVTLSAEPGSD
jgi:lysophospholipase L1-like esterase